MPNTDTDGAEVKLTAVEGFKSASRGLYGPIPDELGSTAPFSECSSQLLKYHGTYQQDNRDTRTERKKAGLDKEYRMMLRTKFPAGHLTAEQYLACDALATRYGQNDMRVTSRQDFQFHGVLKGNLRALIHDLNLYSKVTTFGCCGDVVRNTTGSPVADIDPKYRNCGVNLLDVARRISAHFLPKTRSYYDLWLDDEKATVNSDGTVTFAADVHSATAVEEPVYGTSYLPRKFKIGVTTDFDNSIDVFTNDAGVIAATESGRVVGYEILAGGGLGYTHNKAATFPRLATPIAFLTDEKEIVGVLEAIVKIFRDFGGRSDRKHARLKYLIEDWGVDKFRAKVAEYYGKPLPEPRNIQPGSQPDYLGWSKQIQPGSNYVGIWVENGRIRDFGGSHQFKSGLRAIVERFKPDIRLTAQHRVILANIRDEDVAAVQALLDEYSIPTDKGISTIRRAEMACPALPLCSLAMSEAERALPDVMKAIEDAGHGDADVTIRMSGCPNNCSRPRTAEIGIVGWGTDRYQLYVAGHHLGTRLNATLVDKIATKDLAPAIAALLDAWKAGRADGERFGDWSARVGIDELRPLVSGVVAQKA
ncbi:MAG: NADPH-dependent assimilatory sulfite reductase hemoprotein subunit [Candidatus Hydrogenedentes bacterium]|nr:NADPH-dependent assimilatory sulfite reductase hemoprotein subunit [Candidatus Hydrogenedentota bacterium]